MIKLVITWVVLTWAAQPVDKNHSDIVQFKSTRQVKQLWFNSNEYSKATETLYNLLSTYHNEEGFDMRTIDSVKFELQVMTAWLSKDNLPKYVMDNDWVYKVESFDFNKGIPYSFKPEGHENHYPLSSVIPATKEDYNANQLHKRVNKSNATH